MNDPQWRDAAKRLIHDSEDALLAARIRRLQDELADQEQLTAEYRSRWANKSVECAAWLTLAGLEALVILAVVVALWSNK